MMTSKSARLMTAATALIGLLSLGFLPQAPAANAQTPVNPPVQAFGQGKKRERHPEIKRALKNLERAQDNLQKAQHDFAGHREKALDLTQQAIAECKAALAADKH